MAALPDPEQRTALQQALAFARARHGDQTRRGSDTPYWVHLVRVAMELARWGERSSVLLQGALLHDTVEDTRTTIEEIRTGFGPEVADIVDWLTAPPDMESLRVYYERLRTQAPPEVVVIKIADRTDNLRSIQALVMRTGERYRVWAGAYLGRTVWQVLPLAAGASSVARVDLVTAMLQDYSQPVVMGPTERADLLAYIFQASGWLPKDPYARPKPTPTLVDQP